MAERIHLFSRSLGLLDGRRMGVCVDLIEGLGTDVYVRQRDGYGHDSLCSKMEILYVAI